VISTVNEPVVAGNVLTSIVVLNKVRAALLDMQSSLNSQGGNIDTGLPNRLTMESIRNQVMQLKMLNSSATSIAANTLNTNNLNTSSRGLVHADNDNRLRLKMLTSAVMAFPTNYYGVLKIVNNAMTAVKITLTVPTGYVTPISIGNNQTLSYTGLSALTIIKLQPFVHAVATGVIVPYCGSTVPSGWARCDGSAIDSTNVALKSALDGSQYLPDMRGLSVRVFDPTGNIDIDAAARKNKAGVVVGNKTLSYQDDALPSHIHNLTTGLSQNLLSVTSLMQATAPPATTSISLNSSVSTLHGIGTNITMSSNTNTSGQIVYESEPPSMKVQWIIKL
jgi:microcystin-dependent protein